MSNLTASMATPLEFKWKDKTYQVSLITMKVKSDFEKRQFARARDAAGVLKEIMTPAEYKEHLHVLNQDYIHGAFGLESENGIAFAQTSNGAILLCSLLFGLPEEEMTKLMLECREQITSLLEVVIAESFGIVVPDKPVVETVNPEAV